MERLFHRWGCRALLNGSPVQVIFQPKEKALQRVLGPLGAVPQGESVCFFPARCEPRPEDTLTLGPQAYILCRAEPALGPGGKRLYWKARCRQKGGEAL